jgi:hypothetical protein
LDDSGQPKNEQLPLVENTVSRFIVTVEFISLVDTAATPANP